MTPFTLSVFISGEQAGTLRMDESGQIRFRYLAGYSGVPLSLSMPLGKEEFGDRVVRPYLMGLLPDDPAVRRQTARRFNVSGENPFQLLRFVGLDCPGAVQICPSGEEDSLLRKAILVPEDDSSIGQRLSEISQETESSWILEDEHWSLGGAQAKIALRFSDGFWYRCEGSAATTHILKPGISGLRLQALNEFACMKLASMAGIFVSRVEYRAFSGQPAIVVKRFDRFEGPDGSVKRLHQEDFCQALSVLPSKKYASDGGPNTTQIISLLKRTSAAEENVATFIGYQFFNYLIGGSDAHAKNYSLLYGEDGRAQMAPLYDVASIFPYMSSSRETRRMAMSIGGENRFGRIGKQALAKLAADNGLDDFWCLELMENLAESVLKALPQVGDVLNAIDEGQKLNERLLVPIRRNVEITLERLFAVEK